MQDRESRLPQVVFLVGVAVALSGNFLSIPIVMKAGFVCICLAILLVGIEMLLTGRAVFTAWPGGRSWGHYERFSGLPARLWGILFLIFGGFLGALTLADIVFPSGAEAVWAGLMDTPRGMGLFLPGVGAVATMYGILRIIAGTGLPGRGLGALVSNSLQRIFGGLVLLLGLVLALLGLVLFAAPDIVLTPINHILQSIPTPPIPPAR